MNYTKKSQALNPRIHTLDTIKCVLIFLVVFAHLLELFLGNPFIRNIYLTIYSFHIPLFVFCSGYVSQVNSNKILSHMLWPYVVFQLAYQLFNKYVLQQSSPLTFFLPNWIMWYLLALTVWNLLLPLIDFEVKYKKWLVLLIVFIISIICGFDPYARYTFSLSRILVFFPFFIAGYYFKNTYGESFFTYSRTMKHVVFGILALIIIIVGGSYIAMESNTIKATWFYGSVGYDEQIYTWVFRLFTQLLAFFWIMFLVIFIPNKELPLLSHIGSNTMPIYLLHGFIIKLFAASSFLDGHGVWTKAFAAIAFSIIMLLVFSSKPVIILFNFLINWHFNKPNSVK